MPAPGFRLASDDCHVWTLPLEQPPKVLEQLRCSLSQEEIRRADRYRFVRQRRQFILTRGALRGLLGCYLDMAPEHCRITLSESGKPELAATPFEHRQDASRSGDRSPIHPDDVSANVAHASDQTKGQPMEHTVRFNVAHAGDQALIAIARDVEVGVDIELLRPLDERQALADMILSPTEKERWQLLSEEMRIWAFYALWTRKEAVAKAIGQGLLMELNTLGVSFESGLPARLLEIPQMYGRPQDWTLVALDAAAGYAAALAAPARGIRVAQKTWHPQGVPLH